MSDNETKVRGIRNRIATINDLIEAGQEGLADIQAGHVTVMKSPEDIKNFMLGCLNNALERVRDETT